MKRIIIIIAAIASTVIVNAQSIKIKNSNTHWLDPSGVYLHNGAMGSKFNIGPTIAQIEHVEASNHISSFGYLTSGTYTSTPQLLVDINSVADGNPVSGGVTWNNALVFGGFGSGECISSKRTQGNGLWGIDLASRWKNRMHIGNDGAIGVGTTNGQSSTKAIDGRFNIHNYNSGEPEFYKGINLYTSANYDALSNRTGIANHIWNGTRGNPITINNFWSDISWLYGPPTITPNNTVGIINNMRNITAPSLNNNPSIYNYTYGIMNDLNDKQIAGYKICPPGQPCQFFYQPRIGILNVTNTEFGSVTGVTYGSGKMGLWNVNIGGYSGLPTGTGYLFDGWAQWNDGQTFLRYSPVTSSDEKLKQNIKPLNQQEVLKKLESLKPVSYEYKSRDGIVENGFLAQNLQELFPETVLRVKNPASNEELLGVQYNQLQSIAIAAIQAQQEIIKKLEARIEKLEKKQ